MTLELYMRKNKLRLIDLATLAKISIASVSRARCGYPVSRPVAKKIEGSTRGKVKAVDLVYPYGSRGSER